MHVHLNKNYIVFPSPSPFALHFPLGIRWEPQGKLVQAVRASQNGYRRIGIQIGRERIGKQVQSVGLYLVVGPVDRNHGLGGDEAVNRGLGAGDHELHGAQLRLDLKQVVTADRSLAPREVFRQSVLLVVLRGGRGGVPSDLPDHHFGQLNCLRELLDAHEISNFCGQVFPADVVHFEDLGLGHGLVQEEQGQGLLPAGGAGDVHQIALFQTLDFHGGLGQIHARVVPVRARVGNLHQPHRTMNFDFDQHLQGVAWFMNFQTILLLLNVLGLTIVVVPLNSWPEPRAPHFESSCSSQPKIYSFSVVVRKRFFLPFYNRQPKRVNIEDMHAFFVPSSPGLASEFQKGNHKKVNNKRQARQSRIYGWGGEQQMGVFYLIPQGVVEPR